MIAIQSATKTIELDASVVIATRDSSDTIIRAVNSALAQKFVTLEVIVVDDHSRDDTEERICLLADPRVQYLRLPSPMGVSQARNLGFLRAKGAWIVVLDADDAILPMRLSKMIHSAISVGADCILDQVQAVDEIGNFVSDFIVQSVPGEISLCSYIRGNILFGSAGLGYLKPVFRREFLHSHNLSYRSELLVGEDFALICDLLLANGRVLVTQEKDYIYTRHNRSLSYKISSDFIETMISFDNFLFEHPKVKNCQSIQSAVSEHKAVLCRLLTFTLLAESFRSGHLKDFISLALREKGTVAFLFSVLRKRLGRFIEAMASR